MSFEHRNRASRRGRWLCRAWVLSAIGLAAGMASAQEKAPEIVVPLSRPGEPAVLEVGLVNGSITISGYEGDSVIVETTLASGDKEKEKENQTRGGLKRIPNNSVGLTVEERSNKVSISGDWSSRTMTLMVRVPRNTSLHLSTVNNGELDISGVTGDHELSNVNGGITAMDISGSLVANTTNGDIVVRFQSVEPDKAMSFSTWNGKVDLTLPANVRAKLLMSSGNGDIFTDFDVALQPQSASMSREEGKSGFRVRLEKQVVGTINGGSAEYRFKTFNGDIFLRKAGA